jgi:hypothetical protein
MDRTSPGSIHTAAKADTARKTRAVANHRSVRRISSGLNGARVRQKDWGRSRSLKILSLSNNAALVHE